MCTSVELVALNLSFLIVSNKYLLGEVVEVEESNSGASNWSKPNETRKKMFKPNDIDINMPRIKGQPP